MNNIIKQLDKAIAIMSRAQLVNFNMNSFQSYDEDTNGYVSSEAELHQCGNTACFAGYVAISPEFKADGGRVIDGIPYFNDCVKESAIAEWLQINQLEAIALIYGIGENETYPIQYCEITPKHVIIELKKLRKKYSLYYGESS